MRTAVFAAAAVVLAFFAYGTGRTAFCEKVGVTLNGLAAGVMLLCIFGTFFFGPALVAWLFFRQLGRASVGFFCAAAVAAPIFAASRTEDWSWDETTTFGLSLVAGGVLLAALFQGARAHVTSHAFAMFVVFSVVGIAAAEAELLIDEARFAAEVERNGADHDYGRGRMWPHTNCGLVYNPGKGTHATD